MKPSEIARAAGKPESDNLRSVHAGLVAYGDGAGLDRPHRLAHFLAQLMHESAGFLYDREVWGPTDAQRRYEGRADLGNTQPGDGRRFAGRGPIQVTGRSNYRQFTAWCREHVDPRAPDFEATPEALLTNPWEGLSPIWYWDARSLNALADSNLIETITRRINGGLNGYDDRRRYYARCALVLLGREPDDVRGFQAATPGLKADGVSGPKTEAALHTALMRLPPIAWAPAAPAPAAQEPVPTTSLPPVTPEAFAALAARVQRIEAHTFGDLK